MFTSVIESLANNEIATQILDFIRPYSQRVTKLYEANKYFRIITIGTSSISGLWILRNIYLKLWRVYHGFPDGPLGIPLIGSGAKLMDPFWGVSLNKYGPITHMTMGPASFLMLNDSNLIKKVYQDPRTTNVKTSFMGDTDIMFISTNGKEWETRRRIVYSNLMSTLKASFVENATRKFIQDKVFPVFNEKIKTNKAIKTKPLLLSINKYIQIRSDPSNLL